MVVYVMPVRYTHKWRAGDLIIHEKHSLLVAKSIGVLVRSKKSSNLFLFEVGYGEIEEIEISKDEVEIGYNYDFRCNEILSMK